MRLDSVPPAEDPLARGSCALLAAPVSASAAATGWKLGPGAQAGAPGVRAPADRLCPGGLPLVPRLRGRQRRAPPDPRRGDGPPAGAARYRCEVEAAELRVRLRLPGRPGAPQEPLRGPQDRQGPPHRRRQHEAAGQRGVAHLRGADRFHRAQPRRRPPLRPAATGESSSAASRSTGSRTRSASSKATAGSTCLAPTPPSPAVWRWSP